MENTTVKNISFVVGTVLLIGAWKYFIELGD